MLVSSGTLNRTPRGTRLALQPVFAMPAMPAMPQLVAWSVLFRCYYILIEEDTP
jgi:hypothetical protein